MTADTAIGPPADVALVVSDVDGTLVTPDKRLTPRAIEAVRRLDEAGIPFTLISSRPPRGMGALAETLNVRLPMAAFNGGSLVMPDLSLLQAHRLAADVARRMLALLAERRVDPWVFACDDWRLRDPNEPYVGREIRAIGYGPVTVDGFEDVIHHIDKIVGVSDDHPLLAKVAVEAQALLDGHAAIDRSQPYYLDVTHPKANKGDGVRALCAHLGVDIERTVVIGDMFNDTAMFDVAGFSISMGQSPPEVKARADAVTASNVEDGFAQAIERLVLGHAAGAAS